MMTYFKALGEAIITGCGIVTFLLIISTITMFLLGNIQISSTDQGFTAKVVKTRNQANDD